MVSARRRYLQVAFGSDPGQYVEYFRAEKSNSMNGVRRGAYSLAVAVVVFLALSLPVLTRLFGPVVYLPVYGVVAALAGAVAWSVFGWLTGDKKTGRDEVEPVSERTETDYPEADVERELKDLKRE